MIDEASDLRQGRDRSGDQILEPYFHVGLRAIADGYTQGRGIGKTMVKRLPRAK